MRRYDDPVEVRKGPEEDPEQFLWRGKLWKVRAVLAHWVETGAWWQSAGARAAIGSDDVGDDRIAAVTRGGGLHGDLHGDLLGERELWRVEAATGMRAPAPDTDGEVTREVTGGGVFDLSFDWSDGSWQLVGCVD